MVPPSTKGEAKAPAGQAQAGQRVITDIPIGAVLDDIGFAPLPSDPGRCLSAAIFDPEKVTRLCSIPGFELAEGIMAADMAAVDAAIVASTAAAAQRLTPGDASAYLRQIADLTANNQAMSADRDAAIAERDEALRQASGSENTRLPQQIEELRRQVDQGGGASVALESENLMLRQSTERLAGIISERDDEIRRLKSQLEDSTPPPMPNGDAVGDAG